MPRGVARKRITFRLAPQELFEKHTGYTTGALTPVGCAAQMPVVLAAPIAALTPDLFWMGGGQVDLKLAIRVGDFVRAYGARVADVTSAGAADAP